MVSSQWLAWSLRVAMTNPRIALACLILVVLMAAFFVADAYNDCRQQHGPNYKCFPGGRHLVR
jgi:hypothetical protein